MEAGSLFASIIYLANLAAKLAPYPLPAINRLFFFKFECLPRKSLKATIASNMTVSSSIFSSFEDVLYPTPAGSSK